MLLSLKIDLNWADRQTWRTLFKISDAWLESREYAEGNDNKHTPDGDEMMILFESAGKGSYDVTEDYEEWLKTLN